MRNLLLAILGLGSLCGSPACDASTPERVAPSSGAAALVTVPTSGERNAAPAPAPAAQPVALFECSRDLDRGFERIEEVSRAGQSSVMQVETNFWGGASGGVAFGMSCLAGFCRQRGFSHYVILSSHPVRYGTTSEPGNTWEATVGLLSSADQDVTTTFPDLTEAGREYRAWPAAGVQADSLPDFVGQVLPSDPWELFSSIHFHYRSPETSGERPVDLLSGAETARRADGAERELAACADRERRLWELGPAAKAAAQAGRWESADGWARELLSSVVPSDGNYGQAVHDAHTALGLVAVHQGDLDAARIHLLKSGMTPGSPVLGSFGPNMSLARALIQGGDTEVVLQYFDECAGFWDMGQEDLATWRSIVEAGGVPDCGANLIY